MGEVDSLSLWNKELSATEVQRLRTQPPAASEPNLLHYWAFDECAGTQAAARGGGAAFTPYTGSARWVNSTLSGTREHRKGGQRCCLLC